MASLISATAWVPRGAAAQHPSKYAVDEQELKRVEQLAKLQLKDAQFDLDSARELEQDRDEGGDDDDEWEDEESDQEMADASSKEPKTKPKTVSRDPDDLSAYNLDTYDDEEPQNPSMGAFSNIKGLTYYGNNDEDPYVTLEAKQEDEEAERQELEIYPTDSLIVAAKTEDDVSQLEVYVYDESEENLYVHHDLLLPAMPLCLEWLDYCPTQSDAQAKGNFIAVGTLDPEIEIWSLDVIDGLYPNAILGQSAEAKLELAAAEPPTAESNGKKKKKKKPKKPKLVANASYHVDAVLSLSWNRAHRNLLASASADKTIKIWDLSLPSGSPAVRSFELHSDKVQAIQWNPADPTVLLSGSWDRTVRVFDSRSPQSGVSTTVPADVECLKWDPWDPTSFYVSMDNGLVQKFDSRLLATASSPKPVWTLQAHDASCSSLDVNALIKGCFVTGSIDQTVKIWNIDESGAAAAAAQRTISLVASRDLGVGKVFSTAWCPDDATTLSIAGSKSTVQLWDIATNAGVRSVFGERLKEIGKALDKKGDGLVQLIDEDVNESDEDAA